MCGTLPPALARDPSHPVERYAAAVQAALAAYCAAMAALWRDVTAGTLTEAEYWRISGGAPLAECKAAIAAATAAYDLSQHGRGDGRRHPRL